MILENWFVSYIQEDPYMAPELCPRCLKGDVFGNEKFEDGSFIRTSDIKGKRNDKIVTHSGSEYELGVPDKEYEEKYPGSKERLLNSLKEI